jgi:hypothetical protein
MLYDTLSNGDGDDDDDDDDDDNDDDDDDNNTYETVSDGKRVLSGE